MVHDELWLDIVSFECRETMVRHENVTIYEMIQQAKAVLASDPTVCYVRVGDGQGTLKTIFR